MVSEDLVPYSKTSESGTLSAASLREMSVSAQIVCANVLRCENDSKWRSAGISKQQ